jgi:RNA polymerase sigma factor (sigma-70 family)
MSPKNDLQLLYELRKENSASYQLIYQFYFPTISSFVRQNHGNHEDAEDIFQETIVVLLEKTRQPNFELTSSLKTYLYAIAKNLWFKRLRQSKLISVDDEQKLAAMQMEQETFSVEIKPEPTIEDKIHQLLDKITIHCKGILKDLFFSKEPIENLMKKMGWKNKHTADNQKYKCIQQMKKEI